MLSYFHFISGMTTSQLTVSKGLASSSKPFAPFKAKISGLCAGLGEPTGGHWDCLAKVFSADGFGMFLLYSNSYFSDQELQVGVLVGGPEVLEANQTTPLKMLECLFCFTLDLNCMWIAFRVVWISFLHNCLDQSNGLDQSNVFG